MKIFQEESSVCHLANFSDEEKEEKEMNVTQQIHYQQQNWSKKFGYEFWEEENSDSQST